MTFFGFYLFLPFFQLRSFVFLTGESVTFHCDLLRGSTSQLSVAWYEKAENSQEAPVHNNNDSLSLTVGGLPNAAQTHVTYYRCTVQNTDGIGSSPLAKLVVLHKGKMPCKVFDIPFGNKQTSWPKSG